MGEAMPLIVGGAGVVLAAVFLVLWRNCASALGRAQDRLHDSETRAEEWRGEIEGGRASLEVARRSEADARAEAARRTEAAERLEAMLARERDDRTALQLRHEELQSAHADLRERHRAAQTDADGKLASAEREVAALKDLREEMTRRFREMADETLRRTGEDVSKAHTAQLTELLTPFREHVGRFEAELRSVHKAADTERARLSEQIGLLTRRSDAIQEEAANLTRALKGDKQRQGAWGEMILERLLEESGLERGVHYEVQASMRDEEGKRWRPDVVVRMPQGKCLVIDSKVSLNAYEQAVNAEEEGERTAHLRDHVAAVRNHIQTLADKGYDRLEQGSVDYVLMFMPIEGALSAAWRQQDDLTAHAVGRGVGLMTPTTLMVALRTVHHIWAVERRESNAEAIADRAGKLHDKLVTFVETMQTVGDHLDRAAKAHNEAMGQLSEGRGNALRQIDMLRELGARTKKVLDVDHDRGEEAKPLPAAE